MQEQEAKRLSKTPRESEVEMTQMVLPSDTNGLGTIFGGKIMGWMDIAGAISAQRHSRRTVVTVSLETLHFLSPVRIGYFVQIHAKIIHAAKTSMEVGVEVLAENPMTGEKKRTANAKLTFVALDENGRPTEVPRLTPETKEEQEAFRDADLRRENRLKSNV